MSSRLRNKEAQIGIVVDGQRLEGSFLKVTDWEVTPDITKDRTAFTGEQRLDPDHTVNGYNFSFSIQELRGDVEALVQKIDDKDAAHQAPATIALEVYKLFRAAGAGDVLLLYTEVDMTCDSMSGSGHGYIGSKWSGFAKYRTPV